PRTDVALLRAGGAARAGPVEGPHSPVLVARSGARATDPAADRRDGRQSGGCRSHHAADRPHPRARRTHRQFADRDAAPGRRRAPNPTPRNPDMDLTKLTEKAQEAIATAQHDAEQRHNTQLEPEHLLDALVKQTAGVVPAVLEKLGVSPNQVSQRLEPIMSNFARSQGQQQVYVSPAFRRLF